jgi:hypothetical protein
MCDITAWICWGAANDNIHLILPAETCTLCFPEFNISLVHIDYLFTYSFDFDVWEGTIKN